MKELICEEFEAIESIIDTDYFGIPSAKVVLLKPCSMDKKQNDLLKFLHDFKFNTITNKTNNPINNRWIGERTKAFLVDVNVQFRKKTLLSEEIDPYQVEVSDNITYNDQIVYIAETSFVISRFLNDPYLPYEKARFIYRDMVINAFEKRDRYFVVVKNELIVIGFILFSVNRIASMVTIELIAVEKSFQGYGVGKVLIRALENYSCQQGFDTIQIGTQVYNFNAVSAYSAYGFKILECNSIYHYWPMK